MKFKSLITAFMIIIGTVLVPTNVLSESNNNSTIELSNDNLIVINQPIMPETMGAVLLRAKQIDRDLSKSSESLGFSKKKPIYIFLNTPGGSIQLGLELIESLKGLGRPIHTITLFAASMGFQLAQQLDERYVLKNGVMMGHRARGQFEGDFGGSNPSQLESRYSLWLKRLDEMDEQVVKRTSGKQTLESYRKQYANEMWLTGEQSVAQGYADKVVTLKCDSSLGGTDSHSTMFMGSQVDYETDKCPINTSPLNIKFNILTNKGQMEIRKFQTEGGSFDSSCMSSAVSDKNKLCAVDPSLNLQKIAELKEKFVEQFSVNKNKVIPMSW